MVAERSEGTLVVDMDALLESARTLRHAPNETITPASIPEREPRALELLRSLSPSSNELEIHRTLGQGGMGIVHAATQVSLGREVALKSIKENARGDAATLRLLREAWITGALEHPNVVPIYDLSLDAAGNPRIVLKKITGEPWSALMASPAAIRDRFGAHDALEWNIRILMQVCNAIRFAHSRGIIHRDLKPDNVMLGEFGEVYVLDWGIAVALRDDGSGRLPLAIESNDMAGTPAYMAPEMLGGSPWLLSPQTDVYLLGAMLYHVIAGEPPHGGSSLMQVLASVAKSEPALPEGTLPELASIIQRAMHREVHERFESAEQLRLALAGFLEHRGSLKLAADAELRLHELEAERRNSASAESASSARLRLYHLFGECRFGFREALRIWSDNAIAREGLHRAITLMVHVELEQDDPRAAALLLAELPGAPEPLVRRVREAQDAKERERAARAALERDLDPAVGRRSRVVVSGVLGVLWLALPWVGFVLERNDPNVDQRMPMLSSSLLVLVAAVLGYRAREELARSALNRAFVRTIFAVLVAQFVLFALTYRLGISYEATRPLVLLLYAFCSAVAVETLDRRVWPAALAYAIVFVLGAIWPAYAWPFESLANLVLIINVVVIWGRATKWNLMEQRES
ncbi:MAG: serine/threonine protein kinase [Myxococcota bacterium]|nr:serine/threonine protein kinase [Myxococcota bacterium]